MGISDFIKLLEGAGELVRVREKVDPVLEIGEWTHRMSRLRDGGKALLFENTGTEFPVLTNMMGSMKRVCMGLRTDSLDGIGERLLGLLPEIGGGSPTLMEKLRLAMRAREVMGWLPKVVGGRGKCQEVVMDGVDLGRLPILQCWPWDGGRFITLPLVHTKSVEGVRNTGMYRMQVFGKDRLGLHWHLHKTGAMHYRGYAKEGKRMPVAVSIGGDAAFIYAATAPLPEGIDEGILTGVLRGKRVEYVKCLTQDLEVPADADIVIEGYVDTGEEKVLEGPFGDHTGFYSLADYYPVMHVTCISHRRGAVYPATIVGVPPQEDYYLARATERIFLVPIRMVMSPEVREMDMPSGGVAHNLVLLEIGRKYVGHGRKVINTMWGAGQMMFNKFLVVSDRSWEDYQSLAKWVFGNIDFGKDLVWGAGPLDVLDHSSGKFAYGSKLGIDCTEWGEGKEVGEVVYPKDFSGERYEEVLAWDWHLCVMGLPVVVLKMNGKGDKAVHEGLVKKLFGDENLKGIKLFVLVDGTFSYKNDMLLTWWVCSNVDPKRDIWIEGNQMVMDALLKDGDGYGDSVRRWPNPVVSDVVVKAKVKEQMEKMGLEWVDDEFSYGGEVNGAVYGEGGKNA